MSHDANITFACVETDYVGLLFKGETEIGYSNQVGGTACQHPRVEGFFVLLNGGGPDMEKDDPFFDRGLRNYVNEDQELVAALLDELGLDLVLEAPALHELAEEDWNRIGEAWVPVKVKAELSGMNGDVLQGLKGRVGILTYPNSD